MPSWLLGCPRSHLVAPPDFLRLQGKSQARQEGSVGAKDLAQLEDE